MNAASRPGSPVPLLHTNPGFEWDGVGSCPVREVLDIVGDTWSLLVIINLQPRPLRFNALKRSIEGISQRMLTVTLRSLERDGLVRRTVRPTMPPEVEYALTELGQSIAVPIGALGTWASQNRDLMRNARKRFDTTSEIG
ncbi:transcriptional regulator [Mesorhizobium sp. L-8-10]|uniref:winged helix-turn-helix transcriptional regulator n=1 Tax=unclassified Mesorhizobium TaxID=325217 RepID=UPI0019260820|nr:MULTISPECIES: helix-turn-helix domain-containing protein [unclassified Mesorhizobium]BCH25560.1 transcriptional regulator [Mesorhizobium sp. L-8-3]BCH33560.1 transcriptional regulator [Mesorhizobium sp. L-8-10]